MSDASHPPNAAALSRRARTYKAVANLTGVTLVAHHGMVLDGPGDCLVHSECDGNPRCVLVRVISDDTNSALVIDGAACYSISVPGLRCCGAEAMDASAGEAATPQTVLMGLFAGARSSTVMFAEGFSDSERETHLPDALTDDEAVVLVGDELLELLRLVVQAILESHRQGVFTTVAGEFACPMCPFRTFHRAPRAITHVVRYHTEKTQYLASGHKQLKVVIGLFGDDRLSGAPTMRYLSRSATLLKSTIAPCLRSCINDVDRAIRLVYTERGPEFHNVDSLVLTQEHRRVRNLYYTHGFAEMFRAECLVHNARIRSCLPRLLIHAKQQGNCVGGLYARNIASWWGIVEDIFISPAAVACRSRLVAGFLDNEEFESISMDATLKVCFGIMGQCHYKAGRSERNQAAFSDADSIRRVFTVRGRTGAVLALQPIANENGPEVAAALSCALTPESRAQVRFVACDNPTSKLWLHLRKVLPNMQIMALDPVHLAIVYEYASWHKRTPGSTFLRRILSKLTAYDQRIAGLPWGPPFAGVNAKPLEPHEQKSRALILDQSMQILVATRLERNLDVASPFEHRVEFIQSIAALCAMYPDEVRRRVQSAHKEPYKILWSPRGLND